MSDKESLTTYQKKIVPGLVSKFLDTMSTNKGELATMANAMIAVDGNDDETVFLLARGLGYAIQAYLEYDNGSNAARINNLSAKLDALRARDVSREIMRDISKADSTEHASIIASFPER